MNLESLKKKALELKQKAIELKDKGVLYSAKKLSESSLVLKSQTELDDFILKSQNTTFTNPEGISKVYEKRCSIIFGDSKENFFKEFLLSVPVLLTKGFSQNLPLKIVDIGNESIDYKKYNLSEIPALIVFENKEIYKIIVGEDNIKKVVKSLTLDINKTIDEI